MYFLDIHQIHYENPLGKMYSFFGHFRFFQKFHQISLFEISPQNNISPEFGTKDFCEKFLLFGLRDIQTLHYQLPN